MSHTALPWCSPLSINSSPSATDLTLPQQHQQTSIQTQPASSSLDQPQVGSGQYQPTGNDQTPTGASVVYHSSGNGLTPPAEANTNSDAIVNAQLTHLISRDDQAQGQGATSNKDALMPDASVVHDIATPRRRCIIAQPASGKRKCAACCMCGTRLTHGEARLQQWVIVKPSITTYMHTVSTGVSGMIMNCSRSKLLIRKHLMQLPANGIPSPEQRQIQKCFSLSLRIRIKPQQPLHLMMSRTCLDVKRLSAWMKRSWTSSGSNTSRGTASKTYVARRMSNLPRGLSLLYSKLNMPFFEPSFTTTHTSLASEF